MALDSMIGFNGMLGFAEEVAYGTSPGNSTHWLPILSATPQVDMGIVDVPYLGVANNQAWHGVRDSVDVSRTVGLEAQGVASYDDKAFMVLLKHAFGSVATTGANPYDHTLTPDTDGVVGLSSLLVRGSGLTTPAELFTGCRVNRLELEVTAQSYMTWRASFIAQMNGGAAAIAGTPAFTAAEEILANHGGSFSWNARTPYLRRFKVTIDNNLRRRPYIGVKGTDAPVPGGHGSILVEIERSFEDHDLYTDYLAEVAADAALVFTGTGSNRLTVNVHNMKITGLSQPSDQPGELVQRITARGFSNPSSEQGASLVMRNTNSAAI